MTTQQYLAAKGITIQQAADFILANVGSPATIFNVAKANGVTSQMLADIVQLFIPGVTKEDVVDYFSSVGLSAVQLSGVESSDPTYVYVRDIASPRSLFSDEVLKWDAGNGSYAFYIDMSLILPTTAFDSYGWEGSWQFLILAQMIVFL